MTQDRIDSLRQALEVSPDNHVLRIMLADELVAAGREEEAMGHYAKALDAGQLPAPKLTVVGRLAAKLGRLDLATTCLSEAREKGMVDGVAELQTALDEKRAERGVLRLVRVGDKGDTSDAARVGLSPEDTITFGEVGGLDDVKKMIHRMIILPFRRPEVYAKYGRQAGGGVMLYGPPGCGKTMLARATAGECELPFFNVRIEDVLTPWLGESERNLHAAFEQARQHTPCVLFLDELDALAFARRKQGGGAARSLVDQMLQELDAIGSENKDLLILAATNAPWDVDDALKRPGRFDRVTFVPPPDEKARRIILQDLVRGRPVGDVNHEELARATPLFSGADLRSLVEQAVDVVIEDALHSGGEPPLETRHFMTVLEEMRPSTLDWLSRARNYVEFANRAERYKDVETFLRNKEVRKHKL